MRKRRNLMTVVCLVVGLVVLSTAVYANYDNASGYGNYKKAIKKIIFEEENFTAEMEMSIEIDGKVLAKQYQLIKVEDGRKMTSNYSEDLNVATGDYSKSTGNTTYENEKMFISHSSPRNTSGVEETYYYRDKKGDSSAFSKTLIPNDDTSRKGVRFTELLADTLIGDLKNNVVLVSNDEDSKVYTVNLSRQQIPELINAGLSAIAASTNQINERNTFVRYEDYETTFGDFVLGKTGEKYVSPFEDEKFMYGESHDSEASKELTVAEQEAYDKAMNEAMEKDSTLRSEFTQKYDRMLKAKGNEGILYVNKDGSTVYFATYDEYIRSDKIDMNSQNPFYILGADPFVESAFCTVVLDKDGRLIENTIGGSVSGIDNKGEKHTYKLTANLKVKDYGKTSIELPDFSKMVNRGDSKVDINRLDW